MLLIANLCRQKQVFAPVALLMRYDDIEDAIEIANGGKYGLGASVFGPDQEQCVQVAKKLECGMVSVNDFGVFYVSGLYELHRQILIFNKNILAEVCQTESLLSVP